MGRAPSSPGPAAQAKDILRSGIPLEMAVYECLAAALNPDWIVPEYGFSCLDEAGVPTQRSIDFLVSSPIGFDSRGTAHFRLMTLLESKYAAPEQSVWLFAPETHPVHGTSPFHEYRPWVWQDRRPMGEFSTAIVDGVNGSGVRGSVDGQLRCCVRGAPLGVESEQAEGDADGKSPRARRSGGPAGAPALCTALHQLRDALHDAAILRLGEFLRLGAVPDAILFVPLVVTTAALHVLRPGVLPQLLEFAGRGSDRISLDKVAERVPSLLVRCPPDLRQTAWKRSQFWDEFRRLELERLFHGLQHEGRVHPAVAHFQWFLESTPEYIQVVNLEALPEVLREVHAWARGLHLMPKSVRGR